MRHKGSFNNDLCLSLPLRQQIPAGPGPEGREALAMPTVVVMDVSLSMTRPVSVEGSEEYQRKHLAAHGLTMLFEHMATNYKLEFTALVVFSSLWELMVPFTRDYNTLQVGGVST